MAHVVAHSEPGAEDPRVTVFALAHGNCYIHHAKSFVHEQRQHAYILKVQISRTPAREFAHGIETVCAKARCQILKTDAGYGAQENPSYLSSSRTALGVGSDGNMCKSVEYGCRNAVDLGGIVLTIRIEAYGEIESMLQGVANPGLCCTPGPEICDKRENQSSSRFRLGPCAVGAGIVNNDYRIGAYCPDARDYPPDHAFFVECGDQDNWIARQCIRGLAFDHAHRIPRGPLA